MPEGLISALSRLDGVFRLHCWDAPVVAISVDAALDIQTQMGGRLMSVSTTDLGPHRMKLAGIVLDWSADIPRWAAAAREIAGRSTEMACAC